MPDLRTRLGRYCDIHRYAHEDEYLVCDFCNEHKVLGSESALDHHTAVTEVYAQPLDYSHLKLCFLVLG